MTIDEKEDFIHPIETNIENKQVEEGLNNEENPSATMQGGDDEAGMPSIQEKKPEKKEEDDKPDYEKIESPKPEIQTPKPDIKSPEPDIENPDTETIIKEIEGEEHVGDKVDIDMNKGTSVDSEKTQPKDEYLEN
jgi:hypothetical protein